MKINKKLIFRLTCIMLFIWCLLIFYFSALTGSESSMQSSWLLDLFRQLELERFIPEIIEGASLGTNLRKLAHMTEYCILEILGYLFIYQVTRNRLIRISRIISATFGSVLLSFIYAWLDEYHQTFVPGRGGSFSDVIIDFNGVLFGLAFSTAFIIILYVYRYMHYRGSFSLLDE